LLGEGTDELLFLVFFAELQFLLLLQTVVYLAAVLKVLVFSWTVSGDGYLVIHELAEGVLSH
jgi:hypothetical protein